MSLKSVRTLTARQISDKWNLPLKTVLRLIDDGAKVEKEHTNSLKDAKEIARDHLSERPDYYKKLAKVEKSKISEEITTSGVRGLGAVTGDPAVTNFVQQYIDSNSMSYVDENGNKLEWMKKHHKGHEHNKIGFDEFNPKELTKNAKLKEGISAGPERESETIGDYTGSSRKVMKVDEIAIPPKVKQRVKKAVAAGVTAANLATYGQVAGDAAEGRGSPVKGVIAAATGLPGKVGWGMTGTHYSIKGAEKAKEYLKSKNMKEQGSPANPARYTERPMYERKNDNQLSSGEVERGIYQEAYKSKDELYGFKHPETGKNIGRIMPSYGEFVTRRVKTGKTQSVRMRHKSREDAEKHLIQHADTTKQIDEISAELVGKVSNARWRRNEAASKTLSHAINKKFIESGKKKDKEEIKKAVKEAVMAMPPQIERPAIHGSQRAGVQRQASRPTSLSGRATGRLAGQGGSMTGQVQLQRAAPPRAPSYSMPAGQGGSMTASPTKTTTSFSQGGSNVGQKMAAAKQTSPVVKGMTTAGRDAAAVVSKAAPAASRIAGAALRIAGGPAATAAAAVMSPTPAGAGENEFKRQETLKSYNPYKPSGRSIDDYEKQVLSPSKEKTNTTPGQGSTKNVEPVKGASINTDRAPKVDAPTPPSRPDYFTRGQAFQAARSETGGSGGKFSYGGSEYQTNVKGEPYVAKPKQTSVTDVKEEQIKKDIKLMGNQKHLAFDYGAKGTTKTIHEETKMDTKELINEALDNILENNLNEMKENFLTAIQEKAMQKLEEKKKEIASNYFAQ